ncbi:GNAT family N-acetyltransferase [Streptomyces gilvosporeus]|uniref:GNAT family N-acetyltransferase n=1 Tax=Streptomyces gilvosporeus TaxID=553510 RepID=A0A1V0U491_9ACTN|nr:GNAT family N-acetyltransferase [Streptomyces gilvosporeus]ARF59828.1 GNAT family N-acetyltransferase [Streptomyces gilvosporeus]
MVIRTPDASDLAALQEIERAAGEAFRGLGMASIADDDPPSVDELLRYRAARRLLAAYGESGRGGRGKAAPGGRGKAGPGGPPVGYLFWEPVDGCVHIEQVSVHPDHARRGIGRALIDRAEGEGRGAAALTLTTFAEVPWNAPYYTRLGFRVLDDGELTPGLREIRAEEARRGLDRWPRVGMRRPRAARADGR